MAWTGSEIFTSFIEDVLENTTAMDLNSDTLMAALFNNSVTPSQTAASASTAFDTGAWDNVNEVADGTEWDAGGEPVTSVTSVISTTTYVLDGEDTPSGGVSATLANVFGCLLYDTTIATPVADQGISYHYFGGAQTVTDGQFTIVWHTSGIITIAL